VLRVTSQTGKTDGEEPTGARVEVSADGSGIRAFNSDGTLVMHCDFTPDDAIRDAVADPENERD
jgi:hypothetical protein